MPLTTAGDVILCLVSSSRLVLYKLTVYIQYVIFFNFLISSRELIRTPEVISSTMIASPPRCLAGVRRLDEVANRLRCECGFECFDSATVSIGQHHDSSSKEGDTYTRDSS